ALRSFVFGAQGRVSGRCPARFGAPNGRGCRTRVIHAIVPLHIGRTRGYGNCNVAGSSPARRIRTGIAPRPAALPQMEADMTLTAETDQRVLDDAAYDERLRLLSEGSVHKNFQPYRDIDWDSEEL